MSLSDYLRALRNHWLGAVVIVFVCLILALAYSLSQPSVYAANATGLVTSSNADPSIAGQSVAEALAKSQATSYVEVATSRPVAERAIEALGLQTSPEALIGRISVEQPVDTALIRISARGSEPQAARDLADAWVTALAAEVSSIQNPSGGADASLVVRPIEGAALPSSPVSPVPVRDAGIGLVLGLLLGVAYAAVRSQLDRRLRTAQEIEKKFNVSVIGAIPATRALEHERGTAADLAVTETDQNPSFIAGEAFRKLRTNLSYMDIDNPPRIIVVTSSRQSDGKSTVSTNLAAAIATSGQPVILVDADLRRPVVAPTLGLVEGAGLTDVLIGRAELDDVLQDHPDVPGFQVLAAGGVPPNPSEMLGSQSMRNLLKQMAESALVVLDAPPLLPVTDAAVLSTVADGAIVVVSYGSTVDSELETSLGNLTAVRGRVLGVVFNRVPRRNSAGGYYYGGYYREDTETTGKGGRGRRKVRESNAKGKVGRARKRSPKAA
ncbi:MAG TPA: polysaccharide biosynthesis tyrosine autokinase [Nocardioides sp.]